MRRDNTNSVSEKVIKKSNISDEKQVGTPSKGSLVDDDSSCCIIGEIANEEKNLSECFKTDLDASKSDLSKVDCIIESDAVSSWKVVETSSESIMEFEAANRKAASGTVVESTKENKLNIYSNEIQDDSNYKINSTSDDGNSSNSVSEIQMKRQVSSVKLENISDTSVSSKIEKDTNCEEITPLDVPVDNLDQSESVIEIDYEKVSTTSEKETYSIKISCDQTEGQVASVKYENISETPVSHEIDTDTKHEKITPLDVPVDNLEQSKSIMETDAEEVSTISKNDSESVKINQEDSANSVQDSSSSTGEGQVIDSVPEIYRTVSETLNSGTLLESSTKSETVSDISDFSNNLPQPESAMKTDVENVAIISENTNESIKDGSFSDICNKSQNDVPIKACVTNNEHSCSNVVESTIREESVLKNCEIISESYESTSSEIGSTLNTATLSELSTSVTKSASAMEVDNSTSVASEEVSKSVEKCTLHDRNDGTDSFKSNEITEKSTGDNSALSDKESSNFHLNLTAFSESSAESVVCKSHESNIFLGNAICDAKKESDSKTNDSEEAQSCMNPSPQKMQIQDHNSCEEKSVMEVSPSTADTIQIKDENSIELNQSSPTKQLLNQDCNVNKSDMEMCSSTIQELIDLKEAQQCNQEFDLQSNKTTCATTQNCEGSTEVEMSLSAPESVGEIEETSDKISGSTQEEGHHESSTEVNIQNQDAENKVVENVVENENAKTLLPDNVEETEILSKSDTDTEEYEEE